MTKVLVTGGKGFVGSHFVEHLLKNTDWNICIFDKMGYASLTRDRIQDIDIWEENKSRVIAYDIDLTLPVPFMVEEELPDLDFIVHMAADSHVDNSIANPVPFVENNVSSTLNILEFARKQKNLEMFVNFSTDEVYGPAPSGVSYAEGSPHNPTNPYSASKSAQEQFGKAWANCWGVPVITTHTMNIFGERQHPEKYIPKIISHVLLNYVLPIHADATETIPGSRSYLHARNLADALLHVISLGFHGYEEWNIAGLEEVDNLELAQKVASYIPDKVLFYELVDFHSSRPGHDLRYALDSSKLLNSGYTYPKDFEESLKHTVLWTLENRERWL